MDIGILVHLIVSFACKLGHFEAVLLLIQNDANFFQKNAAGNISLNFVDSNSFEYKKLLTAYRLIKYNTSINPPFLTSVSMFARKHENQIEVETRKQLENVRSLLETTDGLSTIT
jgi:hypothetical protein